MTDKKHVISGSKNNLPLGPMVFLCFVLVVTVTLFFYNNHLDKKNSQIVSKIDNIESSIKKIEENPKVQIYSLLDMNSTFIGELEKRNKIISYINHLRYIKDTYGLSFDGFNYSNGKISTTAKVESTTDDGIAYVKTVDFIKKYRESDNAKFNLDFINSFEGMNTLKYNINFELK